MQNQNNNIYGGYQSNTSNNINGTNGVKSNNQNNQMYNNISNTGINNGKPKGKKALKIVMIVIAALVVISLGGFALVYTGIIKIGYVEPKSILLNTSNLGVKRGKEYQYDYQVYPENTTSKNVIYESSDPTIADVNPYTGYVTPLKEGTVSIIVKSKDSDAVVENSTLTVTKNKVPVESIQLSNERIVFDLGGSTKSQLIKTTLEPYNATNQNLEFYSSDENVAIVDPTGRVFPVGFGMATITVRTGDSDAIAKCEVIVTDTKNKLVYFTAPDGKKLVFPYSIELEYNYLKLRYGESRKVGFTLLPPDVTEDVVTWFSSDPNVATVKEGLVQAVAIGQATVTARTVNDLIATLIVDVTDEEIEPTKVELDQDVESLNVGDGKVLTPKYDDEATVSNTVWSSSDPSVVSVDSEGNITATGEGEAYITAQIGNGETATKKVSVSETPVTTYLTPVYSEMTLAVGESETLQIEANTTDTKYIYKSNNENVVTVNERGLIYAVAPGVAKITVSTVNGLSTEVTINVESIDVAKITIVAPSQNISVGDSVDLGLKIYPENATNKNVVWTSSDKSVLTVDNGDVKALAAGSATVTAKIGDLSNSFTFNVTRQSANSTSNKTVKTVANKSSKKSVKRLADENDDFGDELPLFNTVLNDSEKEKLKDILLDYERISDNRVIFKFDLQKYGFYDFVDVEKTEFLVLVPKQNGETNNFTKATFTYYGQEKTEEKLLLEPSWFYLDYNGYGTFDVSISVTLNTGEKIEVKKNFVSIQELPIEGVQPIKITNKVAQAPSTSTPTGGGTSTGTSNSGSKPITNSITIKVKKGVSTKPVFRNNETTAAKVTNWKSSDTSILTVDNKKVITAKKVGTATVTGTYKNYIFKIIVNVEDSNEIIEHFDTTSFTYGSCLNLCSGSTLKETNIPINPSVCSSVKPYYIDEYNQEYYYTCLSGNVETTTTGMSTSAPETTKLDFNYSLTGASVNPGQDVSITIKNWQLLNLQSVQITNSLTPNKPVTQGSPSYNFTVPSVTTAKSISLTFKAKNSANREYSGDIILNVVNDKPTRISCNSSSSTGNGSLAILTNETANLGCKGYDPTGKPYDLQRPVYTIIHGEKYASVDRDGNVKGLKATPAGDRVKIRVYDSEYNMDIYAYVIVEDPVTYDRLEIKTQNDRKELALGESISVSVTAIRNKGKISKNNVDVRWESSQPMIAQVRNGKIETFNSGTVTLKAYFKNPNNKEIYEEIKLTVKGTNAPTKEIRTITCRALKMLVNDSKQLKCSILYKDPNTPEEELTGGAIYEVDWTAKKYVSIDPNGMVTAKKAATPVKIRVIYQEKYDTEAYIYVYDNISKVTLQTDNPNINLKTGAKITYIATINDKDTSSGVEFTKWNIWPADAASIDKNGNLSLNKNIESNVLTVSGTYKNKADNSDKYSTVLTFNVGEVNERVPSSITCNNNTSRISIMEGTEGNLNCQINYKDGLAAVTLNSVNAEFTSSSKNVKIDGTGHYTASEIDSKDNNKKTTATITIKPTNIEPEYKNLTGTVDFEVYQSIASSIKCNEDFSTIIGSPGVLLSCILKNQKGDERDVDMASEVSYSIDTANVVKVNKGFVTAVGPGTATITIRSKAPNKSTTEINDEVKVTVPVIYNNFKITGLSKSTITLPKSGQPVETVSISLSANIAGQNNIIGLPITYYNKDLKNRMYSITAKNSGSTEGILPIVDSTNGDKLKITSFAKPGKYTLTATIKNGDGTPVTATHDFEIVTAESQLTVKQISCNVVHSGNDLIVGESGNLSCKKIYNDNSLNKTEDSIPSTDILSVTSSNPSVVSVSKSDSNVLLFNSFGSAKITVLASIGSKGYLTTSFEVFTSSNPFVYDSLEITLGKNTFAPGESTTIGYKATKKGTKETVTSGLDVKFSIPKGFTHNEANGTITADKDVLTGTSYTITATLANRGNSDPVLASTNIFVNSTGGIEKQPKNIFCDTIGLENKMTATLSCYVNYCSGFTCDHVTLNLSSDSPELKSDNTNVAKVDKNGLVTAKGVGSTKITVKAKINSIDVSGTATINVYPVFKNFSIKLDNSKIDMNGTAQVTYTATDKNKKNPTSKGLNVIYESSNTAVAIVDDNGKITPRSPGTAEISATYIKGSVDWVAGWNDITAKSVTITVVGAGEPTKNVAVISCSKLTLEVGETGKLVCKYKYSKTGNKPKDIVTYQKATSSKTKIATATNNTNSISIKALKTGTSQITVKAYGKTTTVDVTVNKPTIYNIMNLTVSKSKLVYTDTASLTCTLRDTDKNASEPCGDKATYSYDDSVISLQGTTITPATTSGTAKITVTYKNQDGKTISQYVTVNIYKTKEETINVTKLDCKTPSDTMRTSYGQIECTAYDGNNKENIPLKDATYKVKDSSIVSMLNNTNMFQAKKAGSTKVTVTSFGKSKDVTVKVTPYYDTLVSMYVPANVAVNKAQTVIYTIKDKASNRSTSDDTSATITSSSLLVKVDGNKITGRGNGTATITVNWKGQKKSLDVTFYNEIKCYSYYETKKVTKQKASCNKGYVLGGDSKCYYQFSETDRNRCRRFPGTFDSNNKTCTALSGENPKVTKTTTTQRDGDIHWTSDKKVAQKSGREYVAEKKCKDTCSVNACK